jgi:hypothetical protein
MDSIKNDDVHISENKRKKKKKKIKNTISISFGSKEITKSDEKKSDFETDIFKLVNNQIITLLDYTYLREFKKIKGSIVNINLFIKIINSVYDKEDDVIKKIGDKFLDNFISNVSEAFPKFIKVNKDDNTIRLNKNIKHNGTRLETITLTDEQCIAVKKLYKFLIDNERNVFGLYGFAGSGKTTTLVEFISYLIINGYINSVAFSAPTNKAVNVMKSKFRGNLKNIIERRFSRKLIENFNFNEQIDFLEYNDIKIDFITMHKLLNFKTDYSIEGNMIFVRDHKKKQSKLPNYDIIIVDECSMITLNMIDTIFSEVKQFKQQRQQKSYVNIPKIIFSGDPAQLPPVNEDDSSIFCNKKNKLKYNHYHNVMNYETSNQICSNMNEIMNNRFKELQKELINMKTFLLKKVVRSRIDNVTELCYVFREWIRKKKELDLMNFMGKDGISFYQHDSTKKKIESEWFKKFVMTVKNNSSSIILTWTNDQTNIYNNAIRKIIFKKKEIEKFEIGDILMLSDFYSLDLGGNNVKQRLYTSEQIFVVKTEKRMVPLSDFIMLNNTSIKKLKNSLKLENKLSMLIKTINKKYIKPIEINCWILKAKKKIIEEENCKEENCKKDDDDILVNGEKKSQNYLMTLIIINDDEKKRFNKIKDDVNLIIKRFTSNILNSYKSAQKTIENTVIKPLWKQWNRIFIEPFANVNYGYSITCHKAQGSSFYNIFVDIEDILCNRKNIDAKKCAYTAITRASNEVYLLL